ncbi:MAG: hypothetical protein MRZ65_11920 [Lachnospiraceae bacterium]|nr:hypothetical protein [Lachnospiraceae bacterium]
MEEFFLSLGMPLSLADAGVNDELFSTMASEAIRTSGLSERSYVKLNVQDVEKIFESCR